MTNTLQTDSLQIKTEAILSAAQALATRVRRDHSDLPPLVFTLASDKSKHGHFAPRSWVDSNEGVHHEVFLGAESLGRGAEGTLGTLLHEFAHALAHVRDIKDTSNQGVYHNARFKSLAEELGLTINKYKHHGWTLTTVPAGTVERYQTEYDLLAEAITGHRAGFRPEPSVEDLLGQEDTASAPAWRMVCPNCNDPVRIGKKWFEENMPTCGCGEPYELVFE